MGIPARVWAETPDVAPLGDHGANWCTSTWLALCQLPQMAQPSSAADATNVPIELWLTAVLKTAVTEKASRLRRRAAQQAGILYLATQAVAAVNQSQLETSDATAAASACLVHLIGRPTKWGLGEMIVADVCLALIVKGKAARRNDDPETKRERKDSYSSSINSNIVLIVHILAGSPGIRLFLHDDSSHCRNFAATGNSGAEKHVLANQSGADAGSAVVRHICAAGANNRGGQSPAAGCTGRTALASAKEVDTK